jgi:hypothetical protein
VAVTFDAKFEKGASGQASPFSFVSNAGTVTGTVGANSNRILIGYIAFRGLSSSAVAMTWNGVSMTAISGASSLGLAGAYDIYLFGLINPDTGAQTLSASWTGGSASPVVLGAISVYNADQTTGWQNGGSDTATGTSASSTVTSANGNMAIVGHVNDNASSTTINTGTSAFTDTAFNGNYAMGYNASSGASTTVAWTLGSSVAWANVKVDVIAFSGGGGSASPSTASLTLLGVQ